MHKIISFLREVSTEFKKVSWPSREELVGLTSAVIVATILLSIYTGILDFLLFSIIKAVIR
ncbi:MAG: preprotein translocase subunit SecE [candidate division Zixibacteria bacterium 4484_93]|nr:MAG: preprotein translocase subunit SecE [candidate division Zixibacteria bacterium 4484_93]RKZ33615.1 MAG: preprotein translocase subunit SecE [bacterium]